MGRNTCQHSVATFGWKPKFVTCNELDPCFLELISSEWSSNSMTVSAARCRMGTWHTKLSDWPDGPSQASAPEPQQQVGKLAGRQCSR